jgi:hypothetical protein
MSKYFRSLTSPIAAMIAVAVMAMATPARADLTLYFQEDGGAIVQQGPSSPDFTTVSFNGTYGDFAITLLGGSTKNTATKSDVLSSTTEIVNSDPNSSHTLTIYISQTNYTLPSGSPLVVESGLSGTVNGGSVGLPNIFQAYADKNNTLLGMSDYTNGPQSATLHGTTFDTGSASGAFTRTGDYSLTSVSTFVLSVGGDINYSNHINVTPTPEPSTMALAGLGALGFVVYGLRRRKATDA